MSHTAVPYVLAAPGYLVGGGAWEQLTEWLRHGHGWRDVSRIDQHTVLHSPDGRSAVALDRRYAWTWSLCTASVNGRGGGAAVLGGHLPVEYVTTVVEAMLEPVSVPDSDVLGPLRETGWTVAEADGLSVVSPDGLVHVSDDPTAKPGFVRWRADCTVDGFEWWTAAFSADTPPDVVAAFTRSLASDAPLPRMAIGTPLYKCAPYTRTSPTSYDFDAEQTLLDTRIAEARARRLADGSPAAQPPSTTRLPLRRTR
ncbi:DUF317 domain-containing protein [Streptomyces griseiscabiei]|uniref:DUF317 domain-containing protein n=1 Tax=Streptomyces griseiscabiei TaxID=2993540 RepID=A0ABU4KXX5_9ACTN|nr:DUF317 domain-containing protein [Streptomyces griseiscabiei]MBZ3904416.1 DUF317 domain-containing protein [Streptomyces griseiscabiei]MDX2908163.1 DUF317 domain-containing protein [Streptomyces griseiscabiei]